MAKRAVTESSLAMKLAVKVERKKAIVASRTAILEHGTSFNLDCAICTHPAREALEHNYVLWWQVDDLATLADQSPLIVSIHMEAVGLNVRRIRDRRALFGRMLEMGYENLSPEDVSPELMVVMAAELNKMDGDIVHKIEAKTERTIVFAPFPIPTGATDLPKDAPQAVARLLPVPGVLPVPEVSESLTLEATSVKETTVREVAGACAGEEAKEGQEPHRDQQPSDPGR